MSVDAVQLRVLGCLLEKQRTTPDQYPLSLNGLRLACNQSTNREPVVDYDERTVHAAAQELGRRGWARLASGAGSRAVKYRQLVTEALELADDETAVLAVLMLRGPQTPGELKQRCDRLHAFATLEDVQATLEALVRRSLVERLVRRPGQKEERYRQLLGGDEPAVDLAPHAGVELPQDVTAVQPGLGERVAALEAEVAELRSALAALRQTHG